jgi:hypothetical protein
MIFSNYSYRLSSSPLTTYLINLSNPQHMVYCAACGATLNWICMHPWKYTLLTQLQQGAGNCSSSHLTQDYANIPGAVAKSWNFLKMHSHQHVFDDIEAKGVTRNYNTKPNENLHGPLKMSYKLQTNFKNIAKQVCSIPS